MKRVWIVQRTHDSMALLNPHGSDETTPRLAITSKTARLLNPHGSDETCIKTNDKISKKPYFLTHTVQMKHV